MSSYFSVPLQVFAIGAVISYLIAALIKVMLVIIQKFTKNADSKEKSN
jgi:hypothetical protein